MFCPYCGTENPNSAFCQNCGAQLTQQPTQANDYAEQNNYAQPEYRASDYQAPVYNTPITSKGQFIKSGISPTAKRNALISLILTFVLILTMVGSYFLTINLSVEKVPIVSLSIKISGESEKDFDQRIKSGIVRDGQELKVKIMQNRNKLSSNEYELLTELADITEKCGKSFSLANVKKFTKISKDIFKNKDLANKMKLDQDDFHEVMEIEEIINIVSVAILAVMIFILIFSAIGGLTKIRGLVIAGLVLSILYSLIFCPIYMLLAIVAVHIALIVFLSKINSEYNAYKNGGASAPVYYQ